MTSPSSSLPSRGDRPAIEALLPHRDPFLFLDAFERTGEAELVCHWTVPEGADWFRGHYPGEPVLPGVLICEHGLQGAAVLVALLLGGFSAADGVPVVTRIEDARFRRIVKPGETLETRVQLAERIGPAFRLSAKVRCGGARVAELLCILTAAGALARATGGEVNP